MKAAIVLPIFRRDYLIIDYENERSLILLQFVI